MPRAEGRYFKEKLQPQIDGDRVKIIGEVDDGAKQEFLADAAALLFPIDWPEPFGLVMIEAMACGTPVIAFRSGSVPEIVDEGLTGFVVEGEEQALEAIRRLGDLTAERSAPALSKDLQPNGWPKTIFSITRNWSKPSRRCLTESASALDCDMALRRHPAAVVQTGSTRAGKVLHSTPIIAKATSAIDISRRNGDPLVLFIALRSRRLSPSCQATKQSKVIRATAVKPNAMSQNLLSRDDLPRPEQMAASSPYKREKCAAHTIGPLK